MTVPVLKSWFAQLTSVTTSTRHVVRTISHNLLAITHGHGMVVHLWCTMLNTILVLMGEQGGPTVIDKHGWHTMVMAPVAM